MNVLNGGAPFDRPHHLPDASLAQVEALFPSGVVVAATDPNQDYSTPFAEERAAMACATAARRLEFFAGRAAIHLAMARLGGPTRPVRAGKDRAPIWPVGLVGSLTHDPSICIAALGVAGKLRSLGVDVEARAPLAPRLIPEICTLAERAWLTVQPEAERGILARLIFSAKECAYKCQYPLSGVLFGFDALEITPDLDTGQFEARFVRDVAGFAAGRCLHGRFAMIGDLIVTATALTQGPHGAAQGLWGRMT